MSYQEMAYVYDQFMDNAPYEDWVTLTEEVMKMTSASVKNILDLGCGTGEITSLLANKGYKVTGVDYSEEMLSVADQKATEKGTDITWIKQDLVKLSGLTDFDLAVSFFDVINYISQPEDVQRVFTNVAAALKENGLFIFDVHSLFHVENNMINHTFADVQEDMSYIWFCEQGDQPGEMYHDLTFFIKNNNYYKKFEEYHFQKTLSIDQYNKLLEEAGFDLITIYPDFSLSANQELKDAERLFFIAKKKPK